MGDDWGDTSAGWIREFFGPARDLLRKLPWIVLRGNHEECDRSGHGWFRYLEPRPSESFVGGGDINAPYCVTSSNPYNVEFDHDNWLVVDTSSVAGEDVSIDSYPPEEYTKMDAEAAGTAPVLSLDSCDTKPASGDLENHSELPPIVSLSLSLSIYLYIYILISACILGHFSNQNPQQGSITRRVAAFLHAAFAQFAFSAVSSVHAVFLMLELACLHWIHFDLIQWQASCSLVALKTWPNFPAVNWYVSMFHDSP